MQVKVSEGSAFERTLEVTLEQSKVEGAYQRAFGKAVKRLRLPGFRPGKVPPNMAKKYISDDGLGSDVVEDLVPEAYRQALQTENLQPISEPKWELVQRSRGKDLIFKVSFEVKPQLEIQNYKGMKVKNEALEVTDEMMTAALDELRSSQSRLAPVEGRALQMGDVALVDYTSTLEGEDVEGGSASNYLMEMKPEHFIPGFVDNLIGLEGGSEKQFEIKFPEDYPNTKLAGNNVIFSFKVHELKEKVLPELDDDFAKSVSQFEKMEELREDIRARLAANVERRLREQVAIKCIDKLMAQVSNEAVPRSLHSWRTNVEIRRRLQEFTRMGVTMERYLADRNITQDAWLRELSVMGMLESRVEILLESIAKKEGLTISQEELDQLFRAEAANRGITVPELHRVVEKEGSFPLIRYALLRAKVMDYLFENAEIQYVLPGESTEDDEAPAAPEAEAEAKPKKKAAKAEKAEEAAEEPKAEKPKKAAKAEKAEKAEEPAAEEAKAEKPKAAAKKPKAAKEEEAAPAPEAEAEAKPKAKKPAKKKEE